MVATVIHDGFDDEYDYDDDDDDDDDEDNSDEAADDISATAVVVITRSSMLSTHPEDEVPSISKYCICSSAKPPAAIWSLCAWPL